jgi:prepilin-type N-terminal cleavage/methylation domain-containing protein
VRKVENALSSYPPQLQRAECEEVTVTTMFRFLKDTFARMRNRYRISTLWKGEQPYYSPFEKGGGRIYTGHRSQRGFTMIETVMALVVASISVVGAYGLTLAIGKHYRSSAAVADIYRQSRIGMERLFRDISETSNKTITITYNAISFASARDANGDFQSESYGHLNYARPVWQKAIVYCVSSEKLYRMEIPRTDWSTNHDPTEAMDEDGELIAGNVMCMDFHPTEVTTQDHLLEVTLEFLVSQEKVER